MVAMDILYYLPVSDMVLQNNYQVWWNLDLMPFVSIGSQPVISVLL